MEEQAHTVNRYDIVLPVVLGDAPGAKFFRKKSENDRRAADRLRSSLQISCVPDTYQMTVDLEGDKPQGLAEVVNAVMEHYVEVSRREMYYDSDDRLKNLYAERDRMLDERQKLIEQRTTIAEKLGTTLFNGGVINNYEKLAVDNLSALLDARRQRLAAEASLGDDQNSDAIEAGIEASADDETLHDTSLLTYRAALNGRRAELLSKIQGLSPKHPGRIAAEKDIAAIDAELLRATEEAKKVAAANLRGQQVGKLAQSSDLERKLAKEADDIRMKANDYMRNYQTAMELGDELDRVQKRMNATEDRINSLQLEVKAPGFVRIFSTAMTPDIPIKGGRMKLLKIVIALALLMGLAVPTAIDFFDPKIRSTRELEDVLGLPSSGGLPLSFNPMAHSAEMIRLAVVVRRGHSRLTQRALTISALKHGSGSTTISLGLGKALDILGVRTLVIEANPVTPDVRYLSAEARPGVVRLLAGEATLEQCINPGTAELPDRICTGEGAREMDLMTGTALLALVAQAREYYDFVLIDAPPVGCSLLGEEVIRQIDAVLFVSHANRDCRKEIKMAMKTIEKLRPHTFGSVLNMLTSDKERHDPSAVLAS
jgi:Mrp family chromosome partitioning ATPase